VYTIKFHPDGSIDFLKAQFVAEGILLWSRSLSSSLDITCSQSWHLDVKNAFLHVDLLAEVYTEQPPGFVVQGEYRGSVYKL
jgi:hypothetical protein